jgi:hypothetical protein
VLLLWVLLLGAPRRIIIRIKLSQVMFSSEEWWEGNSSSLDDGLLRNLMGLSDIFFVDWKRKG